MQSKIIKISILTLALGLLGGCAALPVDSSAIDAVMSKAIDAYNLATNAREIVSEAVYVAQ